MKFRRALGHGARDGRAPRGARGLKSCAERIRGDVQGRAPRGARGLKSFEIYIKAGTAEVAPLAGRVD